MPPTELFTGTVIPADNDYAELARRPLEAEQWFLDMAEELGLA